MNKTKIIFGVSLVVVLFFNFAFTTLTEKPASLVEEKEKEVASGFIPEKKDGGLIRLSVLLHNFGNRFKFVKRCNIT